MVELLFNYISMLRREGPQKWVYEELAEVAKTKFQFQEEEDATEYTERLASDMFMYKPPHILNGEFLHDTFDTRLVSPHDQASHHLGPLPIQTFSSQVLLLHEL